jgi:hypothetical protein
MYNILGGIWFLPEGERKIGAATYFFAIFANKVWVLIFVRLMRAAAEAQRIYRSTTDGINRMRNAVFYKGLQSAVNSYTVGGVEEVLNFGERQVLVLRNHLLQHQHTHRCRLYIVVFKYFNDVGIH